MEKLPDDIRQMVDSLCQKGDQFAGMEQFDDAIEKYGQAWDLLPSPKSDWPAATWILIAVGDAYFRLKEYEAATEMLFDALEFPDGEGNPFLYLRLGQSLLELGDLDEAMNSLEEAYRLGGDALFVDEEPKYLGFIKPRLKSMPTQKPGGRFNHPLG